MELTKALADCSPEVRAAALLLFQGAESAEESQAILTLVMDGRRRSQRARYEYGGPNDDGARVTMPARIPAGLAKAYQDCARRRGLSSYAWMREAMARQFRRDTDPKTIARAARRNRKKTREAARKLQKLLDEGRFDD